MSRKRPRQSDSAFSTLTPLLVGATEDHTVPASLANAAYKRYEKSAAKTDYLEFDGRPHLHMVAPDWQEVAQAIDSWLDGVLDAPLETVPERSV